MHIGKNIGKIRELLGIKQESLALTLKLVSKLFLKLSKPQISGNKLSNVLPKRSMLVLTWFYITMSSYS
jgi:predicted ATPase